MLLTHDIHTYRDAVPGSAPLNVRARPVKSDTVAVQWDEPKIPNGMIRVSSVY